MVIPLSLTYIPLGLGFRGHVTYTAVARFCRRPVAGAFGSG